MLQKVIYTDKDGWKQVRLVPNDLSPLEYYQGILIGPPDLSSLSLDGDTLRALNNALVEAELITFEDLNGRRADLFKIAVQTCGEQAALAVRYQVLGIYQRDWFPELFEANE